MPIPARFALLLGAAALPLPAMAQPAPLETSEADDRIVVRAGGLERLDMLASTSVLDEFGLEMGMDGQIGEVLEGLAGVTSTSFAPGASRPVLRGFQGERVRVLSDGVGTIDASNVSADHGVTINPLIAERIEVLRGPASLLFGSSAIGGAVNVIDKRIPTRLPADGFDLDLLVAGNTAHDLREAAGSADLALGGGLVWHVDGSWRRTNDVEIPGFAVAPGLRAQLLEEAEEEAEDDPEAAAQLLAAANQRFTVPNTATRTFTLGSGLAWITPDASIGVSAGWYDSRYGLPARPGGGHHHHEDDHDHDDDHDHHHDDHDEGHEHGEEDVSIDLQQLRLDLRGQVHVSDNGFLHDLLIRLGYSDYTHTEFEGDEVGTVFNVKGFEGRFELIQNPRALGNGGEWRGSTGLQIARTDFEAIGAEAFVPPNVTEQFGLFALQEFDFGAVEAEVGARFERTSIESEILGLERDFSTFSGALGLSYTIGNDVRFGLNGSRAQRAPSAEELFADGPHIATGQYEIGDPTLARESAWGLEGYVQAGSGGVSLRAALYRNWFDNFIFLAETGEEEDELPVFVHSQQDATHTGFEAEASFPLFGTGNGRLLADLSGSWVRATFADGTPVPRIPPLSASGALEWRSPRLDLRGEVQWHDAQERVAEFESPTDGFTHVNLALRYRMPGWERVSLLFQADNVFDVEGRRHASFTKDYVPLAGRNFRLTLRASF